MGRAELFRWEGQSYSDGKGRAIPIGRALAIPGGIVSSTTAERNEVKRDAGGLDRA